MWWWDQFAYSSASIQRRGVRPAAKHRLLQLRSSKWPWWCALSSKQDRTTWTWNQQSANISKQWSVKKQLLSCRQNPDDLVLLAIPSFAISFATPCRWCFFSPFVASICLKSALASFPERTLCVSQRNTYRTLPSVSTYLIHISYQCLSYFSPDLVLEELSSWQHLDWHDWHCIWWPVATAIIGWWPVAGWPAPVDSCGQPCAKFARKIRFSTFPWTNFWGDVPSQLVGVLAISRSFCRFSVSHLYTSISSIESCVEYRRILLHGSRMIQIHLKKLSLSLHRLLQEFS